MKKIVLTALLVLGIASFAHAASTSLRIGATGEVVRTVQQNLVAAGIPVSVTGTYDQKTAAAVKTFQSRQGIVADGIAGKTTQALLGTAVTQDTKTASTTTASLTGTGGGTAPTDPWTTLCADGDPHLQVLSPNGGEIFQAGDQIKVTWRTCNMLKTEKVFVGFDTSFAMTAFGISNSAQSNTGSATLVAQPSWFVSGGFQSGKFYKVFVYTASNVASDNSNDRFTINGPVTTGPVDVCPNLAGVQPVVPNGYTLVGGQCIQNPIPVPVDWATLCSDGKPHVQVLSPNGGETYSSTQPINVLWKSCNASGLHMFFGMSSTLTNSNSEVSADSLDNDGNALITIPGWVVAGNYYKMYVSLQGNPALSDYSDNTFYITTPPVSTKLPTVQTLAPYQVISNGATLSGYVNMNNSCPGHAYFHYGLQNGTVMNSQITSLDATWSNGVLQTVTGLTPGMYQYRAVADNCNGTVMGNWMNFSVGVPTPVYQCNDGIDNDGDGLKDYPADPGCSSPTDNDESNGVTAPSAPILLTPIDNNIFAISNPYSKTAVTYNHLFKLKNTSNQPVGVFCSALINHIVANYPPNVSGGSSGDCTSDLGISNNYTLLGPSQEIIVNKSETFQINSPDHFSMSISAYINKIGFTINGQQFFQAPQDNSQFQLGWTPKLSTNTIQVNF